MRKTKDIGLDWDELKREALALPDVEESTSYGTPALKVRGKLMVRLKEDRETIVLRTNWEDRERLMVLHPEAFYITDHYRGYPWVLLRLPVAPRAHVAKWLEAAWRLVAPKSLLKNRHADDG
ncbi:MAG TPA: MmcQ/YjbR family DNA-binding protein [Xanthomonadaceae bacterium]|nr:MmcQ/YjbR family DNA-binding protein [Xanthomonadaceae bacterium]